MPGEEDEDGFATASEPELLAIAARKIVEGSVITVKQAGGGSPRGKPGRALPSSVSASSLLHGARDSALEDAVDEAGLEETRLLASFGLEAPLSDPHGRVFLPGRGAVGRRPLTLHDRADGGASGPTVAGQPLQPVEEAVLSRARRIFERDAGLTTQRVAWAAVVADGQPEAAGEVETLATPGWQSAPGGVVVVFGSPGAPPGVWGRTLALFGGQRLGSAVDLAAQASRRSCGVILADPFGVDSAPRPGAAVEDPDRARSRAAGRSRRLLRGVLQGRNGSGGRPRVIIVAFAEGCEAVLAALGAEGAVPAGRAMRSGDGGDAAEAMPPPAPLGDGVGVVEDEEAVERLVADRLGPIALLQPAYSVERFPTAVWRALAEKGVAWLAALPGRSPPEGAEGEDWVGNVSVSEARTQCGCGVVVLPAPELRPAFVAHKRWLEASRGDAGAAAVSEEDGAWMGGTDGERGLLRTALGPARGAPGRVALRASLWRALTPFRATEAVWQLYDTLQGSRPKAMTAQQRRALWSKPSARSLTGPRGGPVAVAAPAPAPTSVHPIADAASLGSTPPASAKSKGRVSGVWAAVSAAQHLSAGAAPGGGSPGAASGARPRRETLGGIESPDALRRSAESLAGSVPAEARTAALVATFVQAANGGDVAESLDGRRRRSSAASSASRTPSNQREGDLRKSGSISTIGSAAQLHALDSPSRRSLGRREGSSASLGRPRDDPDDGATDPLPAPWSQRVTEAAARLLEAATDAASWGGAAPAVRQGVTIHTFGDGLPGAVATDCFELPPQRVLAALRDPASAPVLDANVASAERLETAVPRGAGADRMKLEHVKMKSVMVMVSRRDVVTSSWWTIDKAGRVLLATSSLPMDEAAGLGAGASGAIVPDVGGASLRLPPSPSGMVRAFLGVGGWIIEPADTLDAARALPPLDRQAVADSVASLREPYRAQPARSTPRGAKACRVTYVFRTHPGAGLPLNLIRGSMADQGLSVVRLRELALKRKEQGPVSIPAEKGWRPAGAKRGPGARPARPTAPKASEGATAGAAVAGAFSDEDEGPGDGPGYDDAVDEHAATAALPWLELPESAEEDFEPKPHLSAPWLPGEEPPTDVSGTWRLDEAASDGLRDFLAAMGVPAALRDAASSIEAATTTITHEGPSLRIDDVTAFGTSTQRILPDGHGRAAGRGGATLITAWYGRAPGVGAAVAAQRGTHLAAEAEAAEMAATAARLAAEADREAAKAQSSWWFGAKPAASSPQVGSGSPAAKAATSSGAALPGSPAGSPAKRPASAVASPAAASASAGKDTPSAAAPPDASPAAPPPARRAARVIEVDGETAAPEREHWLSAAVPEELWGYGRRGAVLRVRTRLPAGRGVVLEERWLSGRGRMRTVAVLVRRGQAVAALVRYYKRYAEGEEDEEDDDDRSSATGSRAGEEGGAITEVDDEDADEDSPRRRPAGADKAAGPKGKGKGKGKEEAGEDLASVLEPWVSAAKRRLESLKLRSAAARDANGPMSIIAARVTPPVVLSGVWVMDREESGSIAPVLRALGQPEPKAQEAAKLALRSGLVLSLEQTSATVEYTERAEEGAAARGRGARRRLVLDGRECMLFSSKDRTHMVSRAVIAPGDGSDGFTGEGPGAASLVVVSYLPGGIGETVEVRRLLSRTRMEQLILVVREGREAARVRRVLNKRESDGDGVAAESEAEQLRLMRARQAGVPDGGAKSGGPPVRSRLSSRAATMLEAELDGDDGERGPRGRGRGMSAIGEEDEDEDEDGAGAAASASASSSSGAALSGAPPPSQPCPVDFSGVWKVDAERSEPLEPLLVAMGVPWMLRGMAAKVEVTSKMVMNEGDAGPMGRGATLIITDSSKYGDATQELVLSGEELDAVGPDGKPIKRSSTLILPWEAEGAPGAAGKPGEPAWAKAIRARRNFDGMGADAPTVRIRALLEGGAVTVDERRLMEPGLMELKTTFAKRGQQPVTIRRVMARVEADDPVEAAKARLKRLADARKAEHDAVLAKLNPNGGAAKARPAAASGAAAGAAPAAASASLAPSRLPEVTEHLALAGPPPAITCSGCAASVTLERPEGADAHPHMDVGGKWRLGDAELVVAVGATDVAIVDASLGPAGHVVVLVAVPAGAAVPGHAPVPVHAGLIAPKASAGGATPKPAAGDTREAHCFVCPPAVASVMVTGKADAALLSVTGAGPFLGEVRVEWRGEPVPVQRADVGSQTLVVAGAFGAAALPGEFALSWGGAE